VGVSGDVPPILHVEEEAVSRGRPIVTMRSKVILSGLAFFVCMVFLVAFSTATRLELPQGDKGEEEQLPSYATVFRDELDALGPGWFDWQLGDGGANVSDGCVFLNLRTGPQYMTASSIVDFGDSGGEWRMKWRYVGLEIRLRCGDDNGLSSGVGEGHRGWGFGDVYPGWPSNFLGFGSHSPGSGESLVGFYASVGINGTMVRREDISGIDMRQWHNYTILWEPDNATFLVDGEVVLATRDVPNVPVSVFVTTQNRRDDLTPDGRIELIEFFPLKQDQWIQIDYVQVFVGRAYVEEANQTLANASRVLVSAELRGIDIQSLRDDHSEAIEALARDGYVPAELYVRMESVAGDLPIYLEELSDLFLAAEERIDALSLEGRNTLALEAQYERAKKALCECDYPLAVKHLEMIVEVPHQDVG
jgi:hypothetical protein